MSIGNGLLEGELSAGCGMAETEAAAHAGLARKAAIAAPTGPAAPRRARARAINRVADQRMAGCARGARGFWWVRPVSRRHSIKAA